MTTRVSDIIVPEVFTNYVINETVEKSALFKSGIVGKVPNLTIPDGGDTINMPFFNDLEGDPQAIQSDSALSVSKIGTGKDIARIFTFGQGWASEDLAAELAGSDPMAAIGSRVASYWERAMQRILVASANGVFADNVANDEGDLVLDVSNEEGTGGDASGDVFIDGAQLLGDAKDKFNAVAMHSQVHSNLQKKQLIEYLPETDIDIGFGVYNGKTIIVDDGVPVENGATGGKKYTTYLFAAGAFGYEEGRPKTPTETARNAAKGEDLLFNRRRFVIHPRGFKWTEGQVAGEMPTIPEMELAANYDRVYDRKKTRIVKIITNG